MHGRQVQGGMINATGRILALLLGKPRMVSRHKPQNTARSRNGRSQLQSMQGNQPGIPSRPPLANRPTCAAAGASSDSSCGAWASTAAVKASRCCGDRGAAGSASTSRTYLKAAEGCLSKCVGEQERAVQCRCRVAFRSDLHGRGYEPKRYCTG